MLCDDCQEKPASVHITKISNNQKTEKHLCEACAHKAGELSITHESQFSVQDFLKGMFNQGFPGMPVPKTTATCPSCGMTYEDFSRCGKIGCSDCYRTYGERLEPLIRRIHGSSCHTGKVPRRGGGKLAVQQKLRQLKSELERLVAGEEYEKAAKVRDDIKALEKELAGGKG